MKKSLVSVIIPVYNVEKYIRRCLDSVCGQTYKELEIIVVVDQNFQDNCLAICEEYAMQDNRIRVATEEVQALGAARDNGISLAQGEWICFVDSDDYIHPQYVETLLTTAEKFGCLTVQGKHELVYDHKDCKKSTDEKDNVLLLNWKEYFIYTYENWGKGHNPFVVWCNIYHRSLFDNVRFGNYRYGEDLSFTPRIIYAASKKPIAVVDKVLYYYFQRKDSLLHAKTSLIILDRYYSQKEAFDFWKEHSEMDMYALFYDNFMKCLIHDYLNLRIDLPEEYETYSFMEKEIENRLSEEVWYCYPEIKIHPGAPKVWHVLCDSRKSFVLYGWGNRGKEVYKWLHHCRINIVEIWDQSADGTESIDDIPILKKHKGLEKEITILIAIENSFVAYKVQSELRELGYDNLMIYHVFQQGVLYGKYERYLPCMIKNYEGLSGCAIH